MARRNPTSLFPREKTWSMEIGDLDLYLRAKPTSSGGSFVQWKLYDPSGEVGTGHFIARWDEDWLTEDWAYLDDFRRGLGIYPKILRFVSNSTGVPLMPSPDQSAYNKRVWKRVGESDGMIYPERG